MKWLKKIESYFYNEDESPIMLYTTLFVFFATMTLCAVTQINLWMM